MGHLMIWGRYEGLGVTRLPSGLPSPQMAFSKSR